MKMLENMKYALFAFSTMLVLSGCGDDEPSRSNNDDADISVVDSIAYQDSLYSWFMDNKVNREDSGENDSDLPDAGDDEDEAIVDSAVLLPPAGFYEPFKIPVPAPKFGGEIRCGGYGETVQRYENSWPFEEPQEINETMELRCSEFVDGEPVRTSTQTYFVSEEVSMPVVAISVDYRSMFDETVGYYRQGAERCYEEPCRNANYWQDRELPVHVEFFENGSRSAGKAWEIDAGLSIMGAWSRMEDKKSVSISMRKQYQDGRLKYPIFKTRPKDKKFKGFNLRNNGNRFVGDYIEDAMLSSLLEGSGVDYQRSRQVVVFYDGKYYGIHDLRERINEHFIETNYGIDSKVVDMVKHVKDTLSVSGGSADEYAKLLVKIHANDFSGVNNKSYAEIREIMDVANYADYMTAEIYYHNGDWPDNNVRAWRAPGVPFKFIIFDLDHGFGWDWHVNGFEYIDHNMFSWIKQGGHNECNGIGCFAEIYIKLSENPDFRRLFANHGAVMLSHYLTYDRVVEATNSMTATIPSADMERDQAHYKNGRRSYHAFDKTGATLISYAKKRTEIVRDEFREEFGLGPDIEVTITADGKGEVRLDDMKLPSSNFTGTFFQGNDMLLEAVPVDGAEFKEWEDGSTKNPRLVSPKDGSSYKAIFK
ncbi:MAG: CotH kinase family protein [Fibrobacter sp.]|nr:CotH kinase family protein [Fibrobacter sp.]